MNKAGQRFIASLEEALAITKGEIAAARITVNGQHYVPEGAVLAERQRCYLIATLARGNVRGANDYAQGEIAMARRIMDAIHASSNSAEPETEDIRQEP